MRILTQIVILFICASASGQSFVGLWTIHKVTVGGRAVTPVAKWTRINPDGTFESGNGWLKNSEGTWTFNSATNVYLPADNIGPDDPYGGFTVSVKRDTMIWRRNEEGSPVEVTLTKVKALPKATSDLLVGVWKLEDGASYPDPETRDKEYLFIRWDRVYVSWNASGVKNYGLWHVNAHKPELSLWRDEPITQKEVWTVVVEQDKLRLDGVSDNNKGVILLFVRARQMPD